eukprot:g8533.t1
MEETETDVMETAGVAPEDQFAHAASDVFSIVSPYVFHTHAPRVFSEISETLRRAQESSADVLVRLEAAQLAQEQERNLRVREARQYVERLRELQTLMTARVEREIAGAKSRKSLKRKLGEETSRSAQLEKRLADTRGELKRLRKEFDSEKSALDERWRSELEQAVRAAREAERRKASGKVEALTVKRLRSLSFEVTKLKGKLKSLQVENASLLETLTSCIPPPSDSPFSFQRRAEKELRRLSAAAAADESVSESDSGLASPDSAGNGSDGSGLSDIVSGIANRIRRSISERAAELGLPQRISRRRFYSDEEDDGSRGNVTDGGSASAGFSPSLSPPEPAWLRREHHHHQKQQPRGAESTEGSGAAAMTGEGASLADGDAYRLVLNEVDDVARVRAATAAAGAAAAHCADPSLGRDRTRRGSSDSSGSNSSGRRRGLGSIRRLSFDASASGSSAHDPARGWVASARGGPAPTKPTSGAETLKSSSRWQHQRPLGDGGGGSAGETGAGSNAPSLHALLASGEFYPAEREIADRGKQASSGRQPPVVASSRWSGDRGTVELRDHNNNPSRFAEGVEGWAAGDKPRPEKDEGEQEEEGDEAGYARVVEASAQEDGADQAAAAAAAAGMTSSCAGSEDDAGGVAAEVARARESDLAQGDDGGDGDNGLATSKDHASRHSDTTPGLFSIGAGQEGGHDGSGRNVSAGATADTCGGEGHVAAGDSCPRDRTPPEPAVAWPEYSVLCSTFSAAGVHGGAKTAGKVGADGQREKRLADLFPPVAGAGTEEAGSATAALAVVGEDGGDQRPALDDLLRDMAVAMPVEGPGEGDNAGGSVATALPRRGELMDVVLA